MTTLIPKYDQGSTGAVNRPINQKLKEQVSVGDFGAVSDGVTNDTAAILTALSSVNATGGTLYIPYNTLFDKSTVYGAADHNVIIVDDSTNDPIKKEVLETYPFYIDFITINRENKKWHNPL